MNHEIAKVIHRMVKEGYAPEAGKETMVERLAMRLLDEAMNKRGQNHETALAEVMRAIDDDPVDGCSW